MSLIIGFILIVVLVLIYFKLKTIVKLLIKEGVIDTEYEEIRTDPSSPEGYRNCYDSFEQYSSKEFDIELITYKSKI